MDLVEARAKRRKPQWDLRRASGINQSKISLIERGYVDASEEEKRKIAAVLEFCVAEIDWEIELCEKAVS